MLIALFADIHANRQAFEACLDDARGKGVERFVLLGDYVSYGADPNWAVNKVMDMVGNGAMAVMGNHDAHAGVGVDAENAEVQLIIEWTRGQLDPAQREFLAALPLTVQDESRLYVHGEASQPKDWVCVTGTGEAARSLESTPAHITFCGHVHKPALYCLSIAASMTAFSIASTKPIPMLPGRRWLAVLGSVGQPRDGNPAAAYTLLDTDKKEISFCRVAYDIEAAASRIRKAGLPLSLAERLFAGI